MRWRALRKSTSNWSFLYIMYGWLISKAKSAVMSSWKLSDIENERAEARQVSDEGQEEPCRQKTQKRKFFMDRC